MKKRKTYAAALFGSGLLTLGGATLFSSSAFASSSNGAGTTNGTVHCDPSSTTSSCSFPFNPALTGPPPPGVTLPANCPAFLTSDPWALNFVGGNGVTHGTSNKNGDWGGGTANGPAVLTTSDGTVQYAGHLTEWGGGGNNKAGQSEGGFTLNFQGSGIAGNISIHVDQHSSTNNAGTPTANTFNVNVSCS